MTNRLTDTLSSPSGPFLSLSTRKRKQIKERKKKTKVLLVSCSFGHELDYTAASAIYTHFFLIVSSSALWGPFRRR